MKNYFQILGLEPNANKEQIKKAYRTLALRYHPDRNPSADAAAKFIEINEAYEVLYEGKPAYSTFKTEPKNKYEHVYEAPTDPIEYEEWLKEVKRRTRKNNANQKGKPRKTKYQKDLEEFNIFAKKYLNPFMIVICVVAMTYLLDDALPYRTETQEVFDYYTETIYTRKGTSRLNFYIQTNITLIEVYGADFYEMKDLGKPKLLVIKSGLLGKNLGFQILQSKIETIRSTVGVNFSEYTLFHLFMIICCTLNYFYRGLLQLSYFLSAIIIFCGFYYLITLMI